MTSTTPSSQHLIPESSARPADDPIFALAAEAERRARAGEDVLNSTIGALTDDTGRLALLPSVFEAMQRVPRHVAAAYAPIAGPAAYLEAVRRDLFGEGALFADSLAVATPGGTGACHHAIVNFLEPGQKLLTASYFWGPYGTLATHTRRGLATFRTFRPDGRLDVGAFAEALHELILRQGRALVFLNTPCHNPTGYALDDEDWQALGDALLDAGERGPVTLLCDLAYAKFAPPGPELWLRHVERLAGRVGCLFAWTASKAFAQYGARVGALVALAPDPEERTRIGNALSFSCRGTWSNCNHLGMLAVAELLRDRELRAQSDRERDELRRLLGERVTAFNALARESGLSFPRYEGGFFVTVFTPDAARTAERMRADGVFVVPLQGAVRVALCSTPVRSVPRLVESLRRAVLAARG